MNLKANPGNLSGSDWQAVFGSGFIVSLLTFPWWGHFSIWAGCALALAVMTIIHMGFACRTMVPFPHLMILICLSQYALAPWASHYFPAEDLEYSISNFSYYFHFAGPASFLIAIGLAASFLGNPGSPKQPERAPSAALRKEIEYVFWGGLVLGILFRDREFGGLSFFILLLANLRFFALIAMIFLSAPGWRLRTTILLVIEVSGSVEAAMFHELIIWILTLFAVFVAIRRLSMPAFVSSLLILCGCVFVLNDAKWQIREATWMGGGSVTVFGQQMSFTSWNRPIVGFLCLAQSATKTFTGGYSDESVGNMVQRFNQGWIIDRVLHHVPEGEPFAHGETVISGFTASLLPRFLAPNKQKAGGNVFMARFANYHLDEGTSMNLGFAGEMYANFGYRGGILGCGVYALILGLGLRWITKGAEKSVLWWAVAAYVFHWAFKAETDIGAVLNYIVKASLVIGLVVLCLPALRAELQGRGAEFATDDADLQPPRGRRPVRPQGRARRSARAVSPPEIKGPDALNQSTVKALPARNDSIPD